MIFQGFLKIFLQLSAHKKNGNGRWPSKKTLQEVRGLPEGTMWKMQLLSQSKNEEAMSMEEMSFSHRAQVSMFLVKLLLPST